MTQALIEPRHIAAAGRVHTAAVRDELAQTLANDEAKGKALAEIWTRTCVGDHRPHSEIERHAIAALFDIQAIAAPYRASDPVAEAVRALEDGRVGASVESYAACLKHELAKRGLEIVERRDR